ncbi:MAG TPA: hypothetical protein VFN44_14840 [Solirubrobacteraceae bacterium]|nr:hypothetical protein [Solirubrobacteraceae bacterium]
MTRALIVVGTALALLVGGLALAVFLTRDEDNVQVDNLLSERFTREVAQASANGTDLDLAQVAPFDWAKLLIVQRGTPDSEISRRLGYEWTGVLGFESGEKLILLDRDGKVARFFDYRGEGRFTGVETPIAELARDDAVFRVRSLEISPKE